ncbi:MAG: hypothetical protein RR501_07840 [Cloacibacillus sp.]
MNAACGEWPVKIFTKAAGARCCLTAAALLCGNDLNLCICGGSAPHIGAVAFAAAAPGRGGAASACVSSICAAGHRDDELARSAARMTAAALNCRVTVSAGVHIDDASPKEIEEITMAASELCRDVIDFFIHSADGPR